MRNSLPFLFLLTGCPLLKVDVQVDEICVTQSGIQVPGSMTDGSIDLQQDFTFDDLSALHDLPKIDGTVQFVRAELITTADLSQIEAADVSIASGDPDATLPTLDAYACNGDCVVDGESLNLSSAAQDNVLAYMAANSLAGSIHIKGRVPKDAWTMDVKVCMNAKLSKTIDP